MAVTLAGGCCVSEMREGEPAVYGPLRIWNRIGRATGAQAISMRVMEFQHGNSPAIVKDDCDEILYVLNSGSAISIDGERFELPTDTGVYIRPNQTWSIDNNSTEPVMVISTQCPDPERAPHFMDSPAKESRSSNRCPIVRLADQRAQPTADRWYRVLVDDKVGSEQVTQFVGSIPSGRAPDHFHEYEEVLFILKGEGRMWAGETNTPVGVGSCIYLPKGQIHCVENTGSGELRLLGVFYPAGSPSVRYDVSEARP